MTALLLCAAAGAAGAAQPTPPTPPCSDPPSRQFDFWIGDWDVKTPDGKQAGTNRVDAVLGGCAIQEHWAGVRGMTGTSLNMYIPSKGQWHQTWIDDRGSGPCVLEKIQR